MANPTVAAGIPQAASLIAALWVSDQIDQAGSPVKGAWDAKNSLYWPTWTAASLTAVACGTSGRNGLVSAAANCGIALASANDHTGTPYDLTGPAYTVLVLVRPVNNTGTGSIVQNASPWSFAQDGWGLRQAAAYGAFEDQANTAGTPYEGPVASGAIVTAQLMTLAATVSAAGVGQLYKNGTATGSSAAGLTAVVYAAAGNDRRAALFNHAQSKGATANPMEIYAVLIWSTQLTAGELATFGANEAALLGGSFYSAAFDFPVPAVLTGNITLDDVVASGSMSGGVTAVLSGNITLDDLVASGSMGMQPGTITTPPLKNNTGTLLANVSGIVVSVYDLATGALVVRKTGPTSRAVLNASRSISRRC